MSRIVILAGGVSSRMRKTDQNFQNVDQMLIEDANKKSKSLIRLGENDRPFLDYLLFNVYKAGYKEVVILTNDRDNSIRDYYSNKLENFESLGIKLTFAIQPIPKWREKPLGTADALFHALISKPEWNGKKFTMCNSDNLYSISALTKMLESNFSNSMIDYNRNGLKYDSDRTDKFSITQKDRDGFITNIIEKPSKEVIANVMEKDGYVGVNMNIFQFSYNIILPFLEIVPLHPIRLEKELPSAVKLMIEKYPKSLFAFPFEEHVPDLTDKADIVKVKQYLEKEFKEISF
jgi:NDP-sugar pyrophosphorylase family protein